MESGVPQKYEVVLFGALGRRQTFMRFVGSQIASERTDGSTPAKGSSAR